MAKTLSRKGLADVCFMAAVVEMRPGAGTERSGRQAWCQFCKTASRRRAILLRIPNKTIPMAPDDGNFDNIPCWNPRTRARHHGKRWRGVEPEFPARFQSSSPAWIRAILFPSLAKSFWQISAGARPARRARCKLGQLFI